MITDKELFSVVIPAYNREKTIERSIRSVLNQTYDRIELLIIDDGSEDRTRTIVEPFLSDFRVHYAYQNNGGAQRARNNGLRMAKGEYIMFLDSDDEILPDCLKKMISCFQKDNEVGAVYCLTGLRNNDGDLTLARTDYLSGKVYKEVLEQGYLTSSSFISMRRKIFDSIGEWDEQFPASQDDDICFRITKSYRVKLIKEILGVYYVDAGAGKQIGSSPKRVADGWWILWNKFENDVLKYCGKKTLIKHYSECAYRYAKIGDITMLYECFRKLNKYDNLVNLLLLKTRYTILGLKSKFHKK